MKTLPIILLGVAGVGVLYLLYRQQGSSAASSGTTQAVTASGGPVAGAGLYTLGTPQVATMPGAGLLGSVPPPGWVFPSSSAGGPVVLPTGSAGA